MAKIYSVQAGETLVGIAFNEGFRTWETLWEHPRNAALRTQRSDPNTLYVGDEIFIPDKIPKSVTVKTLNASSNPGVYKFQAKRLNLYLSLTLEDENGDPYDTKHYKISANTPTGATTVEGTTDAEGFFSAALPPTTQTIELTLWKVDQQDSQKVVWNFTLGAIAKPTTS
jgi:hypothetical protein